VKPFIDSVLRGCRLLRYSPEIIRCSGYYTQYCGIFPLLDSYDCGIGEAYYNWITDKIDKTEY